MTTPKEASNESSELSTKVRTLDADSAYEHPYFLPTPLSELKVSRAQLEECSKISSSRNPEVERLLKNFELIDLNKDSSLTEAEVKEFSETEPDRPWYMKLARGAAKIYRMLTSQDQNVMLAHSGAVACAVSDSYVQRQFSGNDFEKASRPGEASAVPASGLWQNGSASGAKIGQPSSAAASEAKR
jgi:hypothetical protein